MLKTKTISLLIIIITFSSCQFNQSVSTDLTTGAYSRGDGIDCDAVYIEINGKEDKRNEFVYGENVTLVFNTINGLIKSYNKSYPGLSMHIIKNNKDTVYSEPNLLGNLDNGTDLTPLQLRSSFRTALPYKNNEKYKSYVQIWDKKGEGAFTYELPFTVKQNDLLTIENNGIAYSNIYLWDETLKQPIFESTINADHLLILILENIEGLELINDKVFPVFSLDIIDNKGKKLLSEANLLSKFENEGVNLTDLKQLIAKITFPDGKINNPCQLTAKLKDKNSSKEINITTALNIN